MTTDPAPGATRRLTELLFGGTGDPRDPLVHAGGTVTTRGQLQQQATAVAEQLAHAGLAGAPIGILMPNVAATVAAWFGVWLAGGTFTPLNPRVPPAELGRLIESSAVQAVLTTPDLVGLVEGRGVVRVRQPLVCVTVAGAHGAAPGGDPPALVQFTSGTTGRPKPVPLRHDTVLAMLDPVIASLRPGTDRAAAPMPNLIPVSLSLWAGIYNVLFAFRVGAPVVLMERFDPRAFAGLVAEHGIRSSVLPPAALVMLCDDESLDSLAPLRYVRSVSAPLSPYQAKRFHDRFGVAVLNGYGQTELGGEAVGWSAADWRAFGATKLGSVGRPHAGIELRTRADDGRLQPAGELGELEIRTPAASLDSDALAGRVTDDAWIRTGDLARIDADGFVWVEGRISAMINRGGLKVFPDEVEEVLRAHPSVADAAVVGVADDRLGEVPVGYVVPAGRAPDAGDLRAWCRDRLAGYKVPIAFIPIDSLPRNEIGKLLRGDLVARYGAKQDDHG